MRKYQYIQRKRSNSNLKSKSKSKQYNVFHNCSSEINGIHEQQINKCIHCDWFKKIYALHSQNSPIKIGIGVHINTLHCIYATHDLSFASLCQMHVAAVLEANRFKTITGVSPTHLQTNVSFDKGQHNHAINSLKLKPKLEHLHCWLIYFDEANAERMKENKCHSIEMFEILAKLNVNKSYIDMAIRDMKRKKKIMPSIRPYDGDSIVEYGDGKATIDHTFRSAHSFAETFIEMFKKLTERNYEHGCDQCYIFVDFDKIGQPVKITISV